MGEKCVPSSQVIDPDPCCAVLDRARREEWSNFVRTSARHSNLHQSATSVPRDSVDLQRVHLTESGGTGYVVYVGVRALAAPDGPTPYGLAPLANATIVIRETDEAVPPLAPLDELKRLVALDALDHALGGGAGAGQLLVMQVGVPELPRPSFAQGDQDVETEEGSLRLTFRGPGRPFLIRPFAIGCKAASDSGAFVLDGGAPCGEFIAEIVPEQGTSDIGMLVGGADNITVLDMRPPIWRGLLASAEEAEEVLGLGPDGRPASPPGASGQFFVVEGPRGQTARIVLRRVDGWEPSDEPEVLQELEWEVWVAAFFAVGGLVLTFCQLRAVHDAVAAQLGWEPARRASHDFVCVEQDDIFEPASDNQGLLSGSFDRTSPKGLLSAGFSAGAGLFNKKAAVDDDFERDAVIGTMMKLQRSSMEDSAMGCTDDIDDDCAPLVGTHRAAAINR